MQGRYITTILKLAVLASSKQNKQFEVRETMAKTRQHRLIWAKDVRATRPAAVKQLETEFA